MERSCLRRLLQSGMKVPIETSSDLLWHHTKGGATKCSLSAKNNIPILFWTNLRKHSAHLENGSAFSSPMVLKPSRCL